MATTIRKTLLAVSIAAIAQTSYVSAADTVLVVSGPVVQAITGSHNNVTLNGDVTRAENEDGIEFQGAIINGDVVNKANIKVSGVAVDAMDFDMTDTGHNDTKTSISGSIINDGNLHVTGPSGLGIVLDNTTVGSVINNGNITVIGQSHDIEKDVIRGIEIGNSQLRGDIINNGTINVQFDGAEAIGVYTSAGTQIGEGSSIGKDIINNGTISAIGNNSRGINVNFSEFHKDVLQKGTITVTGDNAAAIRLEKTRYNAIVNTGTINAFGNEALGIEVRDTYGPNLNLARNGIVNEGTIYSEGVGIKINNLGTDYSEGTGTSSADNFYTVTQNSGLLHGEEKSIDGNFQTNFHMNGGTVRGDMEALRSLTVGGAATFDGNEIEATVVHIKTGQLYLARLSTNLTGGLTISSAAALQLRLSDSTNPNSPIVTTGGPATFEKGSKVTLTANAGDFKQVDGAQYTLIYASSMTDRGVSVQSASALIGVQSFEVIDNKLVAVVGGIKGAQAGNLVLGQGASRNAAAALSPFTESVLSKLDVNDPLYQQFVNADSAELARLAEQLAPDVNGGAVNAAMAAASLTGNATSSRIGAVGANSGDLMVETGAWVKVLSGNADQNTRNKVAGYNSDSAGLIIGADGKVNENTTLGVAYSFVKTDVKSDNGNSTDVDTHALTAYAGWVNGPVSVDGSLTYGKSGNDTTRSIGNSVAKGDYDSDLLALDVTAGYTFDLGSSLTVEPLVSARYSNVKIEGFTEKGSAATLRTNSQRYEVAEAGFGVRVAGAYDIAGGTLEPSLKVMAYHDFAADSASTTSAYVLGGNTFVSSGSPATRKTYESTIGLDYRMNNMTFGAAYDYKRKADFHADALSLTARYDF